MNLLVVGGGGREHALVWKLSQSPSVEKIYCAPGNAGIERLAECPSIGVNDFDKLVSFAREKQVGLTIVGPEDPLSKGIVDCFANEGLKAFGPSAAAAQLESSKAFAKSVMFDAGIPTAAYGEFDDADEAIAYVQKQGAPIVVKADGLAAGKGVTVAQDVDTAVAAVRDSMVNKSFGAAGAKVVIEECLTGEEASILAFSDGKHCVPMVPSQDHKAVFDGDKGPNTGGMGAYSPAPIVTPSLLLSIQQSILQPCIDCMAWRGTPFVGVLYAGLMITKDGPKVIEFNCRFGDPETQVVLPRLKSDLLPILLSCCDGTLDKQRVEWRDDACVSVVMASGGYPGEYPKGVPIYGISEAETDANVIVFHAGTSSRNGQIVTNGGRVLNVTAVNHMIPGAIERAYRATERIQFDRAHFRTDIGKKALKYSV
jgi:phosphoribosylamine--glycine ligase